MNENEQLFRLITALVPTIVDFKSGNGVILKSKGNRDVDVIIQSVIDDQIIIKVTRGLIEQQNDMPGATDIEIAMFKNEKTALVLAFKDKDGYKPEGDNGLAESITCFIVNSWFDNLLKNEYKAERFTYNSSVLMK